MCGIAGVVSATRESNITEAVVREMCDRIIHRGPDDEGILVQDDAGLGMRRLSIIDLSGGHQPVFNEDRSAWIVYNGEIYIFPSFVRSWKNAATASIRNAIPKSSFISTKRWVRIAFRSCVACSRSPSTTRRSASWCWRATGSARNRCTTLWSKTSCILPPRSNRSWRSCPNLRR